MARMRCRWRGCDADGEEVIQMNRVRSRSRGCDPDEVGAI